MGQKAQGQKRSPCRPQKRLLQNPEGRRLTVTLREYKPGDEKGMIACIRDEYEDTYFKRGFYLPEYLRKESESGHITFLVAETKAGEIAGMLILKEFAPKEGMCEIASQIFRKKYRGYGLAMPFFEYGMDILLDRDYTAAYCLPVLFHNTTQRLLGRLGLRAVGFVLNVFDMSKITHSYKNGRNTKHSQGIQIRALGKRDADTIYLPEEHGEFCRKLYDSLDVAYRISAENREPENIAVSILTYSQDDLQSSLEIRVHRIGLDLPVRIAALHEKYSLKGKQTANIFLNINDPHAVWAYHIFAHMGYFFTGLKPLCSEKEYMVLHHPGDVAIFFEDYVLSEEFREVSDYVKKCYCLGR